MDISQVQKSARELGVCSWMSTGRNNTHYIQKENGQEAIVLSKHVRDRKTRTHIYITHIDLNAATTYYYRGYQAPHTAHPIIHRQERLRLHCLQQADKFRRPPTAGSHGH